MLVPTEGNLTSKVPVGTTRVDCRDQTAIEPEGKRPVSGAIAAGIRGRTVYPQRKPFRLNLIKRADHRTFF